MTDTETKTKKELERCLNRMGRAQIGLDVWKALREDLGVDDQGNLSRDLTADLIPEGAQAQARVLVRETGILAGSFWFNSVFQLLSSDARAHWNYQEGDRIGEGDTLCTLEGPARTLLSGERTALNFIQTLSAVATHCRRYVDAVAGTGVRILDTRKTLPGLRHAQKYAVLAGGGHNNRLGLNDAILIKENHINAAGSVHMAVKTALANQNGGYVQVEVENLDQMEEALRAGAQRLLLDNFDVQTLRQAVLRNAERARLEASGGITLDTVRDIAETGVHDISIGALTKNIQALDLSMRFH